MTTSASPLFEPVKIGKLQAPGRLFKTATSETRATPEGFATPELIEFYRPMGQAATPLIITGNIYIARDGQSTPRQMGIDTDEKIPALRSLVDSTRGSGSKFFAQLSHAGRQVLPPYVALEEALSASDVKDKFTGTKPRPLGLSEIERIVEAFGEAARRCKEAGFDGVQIHAGHGYLISQFLTPYTNRRTDRYGGSPAHRLRLLREVHRSIREKTGSDYPVIMKLNGADYLPLRRGLRTDELVEIAQAMEHEGLDGVEISVGHYESGFPVVRGGFWRCLRAMVGGSGRFLPAGRRLFMSLSWPALALVFNMVWRHYQGYNLPYAKRFKAALKMPVICVGGFLTRGAMEAALKAGHCDAVSSGRSFIANPHLYRHLRENADGPRCVFCNACVGEIGGKPLDCFHPTVRRQKDALLAAEAQS